MELLHKQWGHVRAGEPAELIIAKDPQTNFEVHISNLGATIVRVQIPDKQGILGDITYGQISPELYLQEGGYLGAVVGRVANRIGNACFDLDGEHYELYVNNAQKHSLHGGKEGFSYKLWDVLEPKTTNAGDKVTITMEYVSEAGEEGFPGEVTTRVKYTIAPLELGWEFFAFSNQKTIINLTNHSYWNLNQLHTVVDDHILTLHADRYNLADDDCLPTGKIESVDGSIIDFRQGQKIGNVFSDFGDVDHNFFLTGYVQKNNPSETFHAATLYSPRSGREMEVHTTEPCVQVYTGNFMNRFRSFGKPCKKHSAICLETQKVPNAINLPKFRDMVILSPKEQYYHKTVHKFKIR